MHSPQRPPSMSGHFLLAPIPESSSDYLLPRDIKLAVLGASRVGKSGECLRDRAGGRPPRARPGPLEAGEEPSSRVWEEGRAQGGARRTPRARFPGRFQSIHCGLSPRLAPVGERRPLRQVEYLQSSRPPKARRLRRPPAGFCGVRGPSLHPCSQEGPGLTVLSESFS